MEQTGGDLVAFGQKLPKSLVQQGGRLYGSLVRGIPPALDVDAAFLLRLLVVAGETLLPNKALVMSFVRRTETPARDS